MNAGRWILGLGLGLMLSVSCHADGAAIAKTGLGAAPACQTCHGAAGEGVAQAGFPRLAGRHPPPSCCIARQLCGALLLKLHLKPIPPLTRTPSR